MQSTRIIRDEAAIVTSNAVSVQLVFSTPQLGYVEALLSTRPVAMRLIHVSHTNCTATSLQTTKLSIVRRPFRLCLAATGAGDVCFRPGRWEDAPVVMSSILKEKMNPLVGFSPYRLTIAERGGQVLGFGQTKPLMPGAVELSSLTVLPEHRGAGVGRALIAQLVGGASGQDVYLTTIGRRVALYERQGFQEVPRQEVPGPLLFEYYAGTVVAKLAADDRLVVMKRPAGGI